MAERSSGTVAEVAKAGGAVRRSRVGHLPVGLALAPSRGLFLVANSGEDSVSLVDTTGGFEVARVRVGKEPWSVAVSPSEGLALVGNRLPEGPSTSAAAAACVSWIEFGDPVSATNAPLPPNAMNVLGVTFSPDGLLAYAVHNLGRTNMSTERVANGWIVRNCLTILDARSRRLGAYGDSATHDIGIFTDGRFLRAPLPGKGPRGTALSGDGRLVAGRRCFTTPTAATSAG